MAVRSLQATRPRAEDVGLPPLRHAQVVIPPAEIATLFSAPVVLVSGQPHKVLLPEAVHIRKEAGTAWTTTGSGTLRVRWSTNLGSAFGMFDQALTTAFFGAAADAWMGFNGAGQFNAIGITAGYHQTSGADVVLALGTADIPGGTGKLIVNLWFREWEGI